MAKSPIKKRSVRVISEDKTVTTNSSPESNKSASKKLSIKDSYAHIYMPLDDIYALGGPEILKDLSRKKGGKDLVVLPMELAKKMRNPEEHLGLIGLGGVATLETITKSPYDTLPEERANIYHVTDGLDVMVYLEQQNSRDPSPFNESFLNAVKRKWGRKPEVFTTDAEYSLRAQIAGMKVDGANQFLLVDADVVNRGTIRGKLDLYTKLVSSETKSLPISTAQDIQEETLYPNQFLRFPGNEGSVYAKVTGELVKNQQGKTERKMNNLIVELLGHDGKLDRLIRHGKEFARTSVLDYTPRDDEQYIAVQHGIFDQNMQVVFIPGGPGSGKTYMYLPVIDMILKHPDKKYREQIGIPEGETRFFDYAVLLKTIDIVGGNSRDIGFLPGDMLEKMLPHLAPFEDVHRSSRVLNNAISFKDMFIDPNPRKQGKNQKEPEPRAIDGRSLPEYNEAIRIATTGYLRGRSFRRALIFMDEFQNLTPYEAKTLIERLSEGSRLIATGDPSQFDNPRCSRNYNGFTYMIKHLLAKPYTALIKLNHNYRLDVAEDASNMTVYSR